MNSKNPEGRYDHATTRDFGCLRGGPGNGDPPGRRDFPTRFESGEIAAKEESRRPGRAQRSISSTSTTRIRPLTRTARRGGRSSSPAPGWPKREKSWNPQPYRIPTVPRTASISLAESNPMPSLKTVSTFSMSEILWTGFPLIKTMSACFPAASVPIRSSRPR